MITLRWERQTWLALGASMAGVVLVVVAGVRAAVLPPLPTGEQVTAPAVPVRNISNVGGQGSGAIAALLNADPFHPERRAPTVRFRMPGEGLPIPMSTEVSALRLIGVAVIDDGTSFALVQAGGEAPRLVRVGERIGGYTLTRVGRDRAHFAAPGGRIQEFKVAKAGT